VIEHGRKIAKHLRPPITSDDYPVYEVRSRQMKHVTGNGIAAMSQQILGLGAEYLLYILNH
jgi:hypothetical protein